MSLQLILGSSGSGKSYELYHRIIEEAETYTNRNYLVIVPEQFTMQTQKDFVAMHKRHGICNIDILSFLRLAYRIFDEVGKREEPILDDIGKSMLVRKIAEDKKENLHYFRANIQKSGFIEELKSTISELLQYSITVEQLEKMKEVSKEKNLLQEKLVDIQTVYEGFLEFLSDKYITSEGLLDLLYEAVPKSNLIKDCEICFDGFTGFTPPQYHLITQLMKYAKKVWVTVTVDKREDISKIGEPFQLFYMSKKMIAKLYEIAAEAHIEIEEEWYIGQADTCPYRFRESRALAWLEHNLFRYPFQALSKKQEDIVLYQLKEPKEEVIFCICQIKKLIREYSYRYSDIAIVTGDIENYGRIALELFEQANIPAFIDYKKDILSNPFVEQIRAVLRLLRLDFTYETMFRYLRSGMAGIKWEEIDIVENYVLATGIKGYTKWNRTWNRKLKRWTEEQLEEINTIREKIMSSFQSIYRIFRKKEQTVEVYTRALYEFLVQEGCEQKLKEYETAFANNHERLKEKEYAQVYHYVIDLFDHMVELLADEQVSLKEYEQLLDVGFREIKIGLIPPGVDQIVIGDIERTRLKDIKVLFFIGVNDGIIPKTNTASGILSDIEKEMLIEKNFELAPTRRQSAFTEQFYLYLSLTKPRHKLYMTYSLISEEGKTIRPSYLISKIQKLFPAIKITTQLEQEKDYDRILGTDAGMSYLAEGVRYFMEGKEQAVWKELLQIYKEKEEFQKEWNRFLRAISYTGEERGITKAVSNALYGTELEHSVSRLETYASCALAHFLQYGLLLKEREQFRLNMPDIGNLFHMALEFFSKKVKKGNYNWHTIPDEVRADYVKESVSQAVEEYENTAIFSTKRNEYIIKRLERMMDRTVWALCKQIRVGKMEPTSFELNFSFLDQLKSVQMDLTKEKDTPSVMRLQGRIDRIDTYESEDEIYVRVIDYKSGNQSFDLVDLYYGLQLQLVVYMNAALELEEKKQTKEEKKQVVPAGLFYYHIDDPIVEKAKDEQEIEELLLRELKLNGLANESTKALGVMDEGMEVNGALNCSAKSKIMSVETNKEGELTKRSNTASNKHFYALSQYVNHLLKQYGQEILEGIVEKNPYELKGKTACEYCNYKGVCGFDNKIDKKQVRKLKSLSKDDVWRKIYGKDGMDSGSEEGN